MEAIIMKDEQFDLLMEKLEEIRCGIIDVEVAVESKTNQPLPEAVSVSVINPYDVVNRIRDAFYHQLSVKTGWGRNEVKALFEVSVENAF
jgi:hypothetical protein